MTDDTVRYTNARFAQSAARIASFSASWAGDIGDAPDLHIDANSETVRRYLAEMRKRLDIIEQWEAKTSNPLSLSERPK